MQKEIAIKIFSQIGLMIFLYLVTYYFYVGIIHPIPALGDSYTYHIPISQSILNGTFLQPSHFTPQTFMGIFNPGSSEAINALLLLLHIPLTISNLLAILALFVSCYFLAKTFTLPSYYALLFADSICTLTAVTRWFNAVSIDVWLAVYFCLAIILLKNPKKTYKYFLLLGIVFGMLVGSKYDTWGFFFILLFFFRKSWLSVFSLRRFLVFLIPFSILGLFWYVRNYLAVGNPIWPLCIFTLPCQGSFYNNHEQMWNTTLRHPLTMANAYFGEYKLWSLSPLIVLFALYAKIKKIQIPKNVYLLTLIGLISIIVFLPLPTGAQPWIMVSSFRYSYPLFISFILAIFLLAKYCKKEELLGYFALANMLAPLSMAYYPKLIFIYFPLALLIFYLFNNTGNRLSYKNAKPYLLGSKKVKKRK